MIDARGTRTIPHIATEVARSRHNHLRRWFDGEVSLPILSMINRSLPPSDKIHAGVLEEKLEPYVNPFNRVGRIILARGGVFNHTSGRQNLVGVGFVDFVHPPDNRPVDTYHVRELHTAAGTDYREVIGALIDGAVQLVKTRGQGVHRLHVTDPVAAIDAHDVLHDRGFQPSSSNVPVLEIQGVAPPSVVRQRQSIE